MKALTAVPLVCLLFLIVGASLTQAPISPDDAIPSIPGDTARQNLVTFVQPDYPPLAKAASVMGKVRAQIVIDEGGSVKSVKLISGHPMLAPSAIAAIGKWKYKPFEVDGKLAVIRTEVEVSMPEHISDDDVARERKFQDTYWPNERAGSEALEKGDLQSAEARLLVARAAAQERGDQKWLELTEVISMLGNIKFQENDLPGAERLYEESLQIHEKHQRSDEAEVAGAQQSLAFLYVRESQPLKAEPLYLQSVKTYEERIVDTSVSEAKASYGRHLALGFFALSQIALSDGRQQDARNYCEKAVIYAGKWSNAGDKAVIGAKCADLGNSK